MKTITFFEKRAPKISAEQAGFELTYRDSGNTIHVSIFTMQIFPLSQKTTIAKYNAVSYFET